LIFYNAFASQ